MGIFAFTIRFLSLLIMFVSLVPCLKFALPPTPAPFHWTVIHLHSLRSWIFSKIIQNRRETVDNHSIWGLGASSTLPLRFYYDSVALPLRSHYDNEDPATLNLR